MSTANILPVNSTDDVSTPFTVTTATVTVSLITGAGGPPSPKADVVIEQQGSSGGWAARGQLNAIISAGSISAPGTYRAHRFATGASVGVDLSS